MIVVDRYKYLEWSKVECFGDQCLMAYVPQGAKGLSK